jgi:hypothetical protein
MFARVCRLTCRGRSPESLSLASSSEDGLHEVLPGVYGTIDELSGALTLVVADRQDHPVPRSCWPAAPADRACLTDCARRCRPRRHLRQRAGPVHRGPTAPGTSSRSSPGPAPRRTSPRPAATAPDSTPRIFGQANESSQECERAGWLANPGRAAGACWQPSVARRARPGLAPAWPGGGIRAPGYRSVAQRR